MDRTVEVPRGLVFLMDFFSEGEVNGTIRLEVVIRVVAATEAAAVAVIQGAMAMVVVTDTAQVAAARTTRVLPKRTSLAWATATGR